MTGFQRRAAALWVESVPLTELAERFGTPCYVYSRAAVEAAWRELDAGFGGREHLICYAVKANSNLALLSLLARLGAGFDIVSGGELERVLAAGGDPARVVFSGVGKSEAEIRRALEAGILCFNVESEPELLRIDAIARAQGRRAPVSLRVNPDVDPRTHPYIATGLRHSKFGVPAAEAEALYGRAQRMAGIRLTGIDFHIGSQLTSGEPLAEAVDRVLELVDRLQAAGISLSHLDMGGGLGIRYRDETPPSRRDYVEQLVARVGDRPHTLLLEPGRCLVGEAGVLLTRVEYLKAGEPRGFAVVDAAMNDLLRPALYDAWQAIERVEADTGAPPRPWDVVGPVCESGDFLGRDRQLALTGRDLLAVRAAGAYGFVMSSNYNTRPRPPEVLVDGNRAWEIREREPLAELWRGERIPDWD